MVCCVFVLCGVYVQCTSTPITTQTRIASFNNAIQGVVTYFSQNCHAHNCLNVTDIEPSVRNNLTGSTCLIDYNLVTPGQCDNYTWNPSDPMVCKAKDRTGYPYDGICGADLRCYVSDVTFGDTKVKITRIKDDFLTMDAIKQFRAFDEYVCCSLGCSQTRTYDTVCISLRPSLHTPRVPLCI